MKVYLVMRITDCGYIGTCQEEFLQQLNDETIGIFDSREKADRLIETLPRDTAEVVEVDVE